MITLFQLNFYEVHSWLEVHNITYLMFLLPTQNKKMQTGNYLNRFWKWSVRWSIKYLIKYGKVVDLLGVEKQYYPMLKICIIRQVS